MSADLWIERAPCPECGRGGNREGDARDDLNVTYNLSPMLAAAGFNGWGWCVGKRARAVGRHMLTVLDGMQSEPDRWRAMNPPNGWGDYDRCLQGRMRVWADTASIAGKRDRVGGWL